MSLFALRVSSIWLKLSSYSWQYHCLFLKTDLAFLHFAGLSYADSTAKSAYDIKSRAVAQAYITKLKANGNTDSMLTYAYIVTAPRYAQNLLDFVYGSQFAAVSTQLQYHC
jgi:hypothetical protein